MILLVYRRLPMKKIFYILFSALCLILAGCSGGKSDSVYGSIDENYEETDNSSGADDNDANKNERPDDAPKPGGGGSSSNGNGNPNGSNGSGNSDSDVQNDEENSDDSDNIGETDDSESGNNEKPDGNTVEKNNIYASEPDIEQCISGDPTDDEKQKVLARINYIRAIHYLMPVEYDEDGDEMTAECSLVIAANEQLSHQPESSWECYSEEAYNGCDSSNISLMMMTNYDTTQIDSTTIVDGFFTDENEVPPVTLGHRRWFLDPWLAHISFGRADYSDGKGHFVLGAAIKVINRTDPDDQQDLSDSEIGFVAYPFENYPAELYNDNVMMSFTVIADKFSKFNNGSAIDLDSATVAVIDPDNKTMKMKPGSKATDYQGSGVPNSLRWYTEGIKPNVRYNVTISNVFVNNNPTGPYQYWFELK